MFLPSLGELEKQQGTKTLSVRSAGAQGDPQSKQGSPTGETGLCLYPAHTELTTVLHLALGGSVWEKVTEKCIHFANGPKVQDCI